MATPVCFGCGEVIFDGLKIIDQYLCPACEMELIKSKPDQFDYQHWIDSCRKFWENIKVNLNASED